MGRETFELQRTDSICPPPELQLLEYVKTNHVPKIKSFVAENPGTVNTVIGHPFDKPILHIACYEFADKVSAQTIETLLDLRADLHHSDEIHNHKEALHFAALGENPKILKTIVDRINSEKVVDGINSEKINALSGGNTALNLLVKEGDPKNSNFIQCIRILIQAGVDVNKCDGKNLSPIFWAAKKGYKDAVHVILHESKQDVDLDSHKLRGKSARDYIAENNFNDVYENLPSKTFVNNNEASNPSDILFGFLKEYNEDAFVGYKHLGNFVDADDGVITLLQSATKKGLTRAVESLLIYGADPNKITPKTRTPSIEIAATEGYHAIFDLLLKHERTIIPSCILTELLKYIDSEITHEDVNHNLCYSLLMKHKNKLNMNVSDRYNSTPLHYAARYGGADKTLDLLRAGASMACRNKYGSLPVEDIDANTLETHLNECLETNVDNNIDKENFMAIYNYKTLMPPRRIKNEDLSKDLCDAEAANKLIANEIEQLATETQVISYMSKSPELKHLLKHPVITSFLYIKWHRIRWFFYTNLAFYIMFCLSLILYILLIYDNHNEGHQAVGYTLSALLGISFTLLLFRELFQIAVSPKTYFLNLENWLELLLIILTAVILFKNSSSDDSKKQVSAIAILLAAFELVLLIGQHPKMSTNIVMLRTVSLNFFKFLLWYSILILAFSLSFYTLFKDSSNSDDEKVKNATSDGDEEPDFFVDPGISLFKTIVMLTGEFDAGSINFQIYPITSHIIFMLFVFMIAIILFNLLNGLAVSDTQLIKSNAELVGHISRIEHIAYIESMFLGSVLPRSILNFLQKYCCCLPLYVTNRFIVPGILVKRVCLFPYFLKDYRMMVYPNRHAKVALTHTEYSDAESETCIAHCTNIYLDKQTAKRTKQLIRIKKEILEKEKSEQSIVKKQERVIKQQQICIDELRKEQQIILNKLDYIITNMSVN